jgi:hypothetical protein
MRKLGLVGIVLVGLGIVAQGIASLVYPLSTLSLSGGDVSRYVVVLTLLMPVTLVAFGILLVAGRRTLAERWFDDDDAALPPAGAPLLRVLLLAMGVWLFATAIPSVLSLPAQWLAQSTLSGEFSAPSFRELLLDMLPRFIVVLAELTLASVLLWRSRQLADRLWSGTSVASAVRSDSCPTCGASYDVADYAGGLGTPLCARCGSPLPPEGTEQAPQPDAT